MLKLSDEEPVDALDGDVQLSASGLFHKVYAFFYNKKVGVILILVTCVLTLVGVLARQMPSSVRLDPASKAAWLEQVRPIYGGWTDVVAALGVFHIFSSPIFLTVCVLLALSIIACTTHRLPTLYQKGYNPHTRVRPSFYEHAKVAGEFHSPLPPEQTIEAVTAAARKDGYRVIADADGESLYSDKFHWAPFGTAAAHAGYVVVMVGFLISAFAGFRIDNFDLTVGMPREVGHGTGLTATANSFVDLYDEEYGSPIDYVTDLTLTRDGVEVDRHDVRVNEPLIIDGVYFHQASFGHSAVVRIVDDSGELFHGGVPLAWRTPDEERQYGVHVLEEQQLEVFVIANASGRTSPGIAPGQLRVEVYPIDSQQPLGNTVLDAGVPGDVAGLNVTFEREAKYTSLIVKRDPGTAVVWIGCILLIVGTCICMSLPHRRQWLRITPDGDGSRVQMGSPDKPETGRRRLFAHLMTSMEAATGRPDGKA